MSKSMGLYRCFVSVYYTRKNFAFITFVLAALTMVYFYLPYHMRMRAGTHYLNPRINMEVVRSNEAFHPVEETEKRDLSTLNLVQIPESITERSKCPACFGEDLCPEIDAGNIKILVPDDEGDVLKVKGVYNGYWKGQPVVIKRLNKQEEYARVDAFLCLNASQPDDCDVSKAILSPQGVVQSEKAFQPDFLRQAWKIMHSRPDKLPVAACITDDVIKFLSEDFDTDHDKTLSPEEKAKFFMSLVFNPESLFLEFAKKEGLKIHFPEILGRCGRIVVTEHAGVPLATYLDKPFKERADIAMMLLGMIFFLQNFSTKWSLVFSDFNFDNFYVKDYSLYIVDTEDMLVSDTKEYPEPRGRSDQICNHDCMEKFAVRLFDYDRVPRSEVCPLTPGLTEQAMYALACERILSYLPVHRNYSPFKGLLHDPPAEAAPFLEDSLRECVSETTAGGRISAVDVLSEMLERYTDYGNYQYNDDTGARDWEHYEDGPGEGDKPPQAPQVMPVAAQLDAAQQGVVQQAQQGAVQQVLQGIAQQVQEGAAQQVQQAQQVLQPQQALNPIQLQQGLQQQQNVQPSEQLQEQQQNVAQQQNLLPQQNSQEQQMQQQIQQQQQQLQQQQLLQQQQMQQQQQQQLQQQQLLQQQQMQQQQQQQQLLQQVQPQQPLNQQQQPVVDQHQQQIPNAQQPAQQQVVQNVQPQQNPVQNAAPQQNGQPPVIQQQQQQNVQNAQQIAQQQNLQQQAQQFVQQQQQNGLPQQSLQQNAQPQQNVQQL